MSARPSHAPTMNAGEGGHDDHPSYAHPVPVRTLIWTFVILVTLTVITVVANEMHLGEAELWIALGIATVKGLLVVLIFMHMWWDKPFNRMAFVSAFLFFALFVGFTLRDASAYRHYLEDYPYASRPDEPPPMRP